MYNGIYIYIYYFIFLYFSPISCSTLLVRLLPAARYSDGQCKTAKEIPQDEWINEGIFVPMPTYLDGTPYYFH